MMNIRRKSLRSLLVVIAGLCVLGLVYLNVHPSVKHKRAFHVNDDHVGQLSNTDKLKLKIKEINEKQTIYNQHRHKFSVKSDSIVIFVQVHVRYKELEHLIVLLNKVKDISECLVIFSHDIFLDKINSVITSLATFPYMQIFFPYSGQLYPKTFPGQDPNDCPRNLDKHSAVKRKCNNAEFPDEYNHYREANFTQLKHHWVWKMQFVFESIEILKDFNGPFVRLEEDYYVAEDLVHVLRLMHSLRNERFASHNLMTLGTNYDNFPDSLKESFNIVQSRNWCFGSGRGLVFYRQFWKDIKACAKVYCSYDDYNWDCSLWKVARDCMKQPVKALEIAGSRVLHLGMCNGLHYHNKCTFEGMLQNIYRIYDKREFLFPEKLQLISEFKYCSKNSGFGTNGGWMDPRDDEFCKRLMQGNEEFIQRFVKDSSSALKLKAYLKDQNED